MSDTTEPVCTCPPEEQPTFEQELVELLNKHNMERYSGTPDWILGNFLSMVLRQFDCAVKIRANWRGESTELPALQRLFDTNDVSDPEVEIQFADGSVLSDNRKTVPMVIYTRGQRNEIGEAKINVTPGEVNVTGTITGVIPLFGSQEVPLGKLGPVIGKGQFSIDGDIPKDRC